MNGGLGAENGRRTRTFRRRGDVCLGRSRKKCRTMQALAMPTAGRRCFCRQAEGRGQRLTRQTATMRMRAEGASTRLRHRGLPSLRTVLPAAHGHQHRLARGEGSMDASSPAATGCFPCLPLRLASPIQVQRYSGLPATHRVPRPTHAAEAYTVRIRGIVRRYWMNYRRNNGCCLLVCRATAASATITASLAR